MLEESAYQVFQTDSLLIQIVVIHKELLFPNASSQGIKDLRVRYALAEMKVASFKWDYSKLRHLDEAFSFMDEVKMYESPASLVSLIMELERLLKGKKHGSYQMELELKTLYSVARDVWYEPEEKRTGKYKELGIL